MNGTLRFETIQELAEFLKAFTGCTATFSQHTEISGNRTSYVIEFNGGF